MKRATIKGNSQLIINTDKLAEACAQCPFSLVCLSGKQFPHAYMCGECEAIWISEAKTLVDCDAFLAHASLDFIAGCEACEPFEIAPEEITRIKGYQAEEARAVHDPHED